MPGAWCRCWPEPGCGCLQLSLHGSCAADPSPRPSARDASKSACSCPLQPCAVPGATPALHCGSSSRCTCGTCSGHCDGSSCGSDGPILSGIRSSSPSTRDSRARTRWGSNPSTMMSSIRRNKDCRCGQPPASPRCRSSSCCILSRLRSRPGCTRA